MSVDVGEIEGVGREERLPTPTRPLVEIDASYRNIDVVLQPKEQALRALDPVPSNLRNYDPLNPDRLQLLGEINDLNKQKTELLLEAARSGYLDETEALARHQVEVEAGMVPVLPAELVLKNRLQEIGDPITGSPILHEIVGAKVTSIMLEQKQEIGANNDRFANYFDLDTADIKNNPDHYEWVEIVTPQGIQRARVPKSREAKFAYMNKALASMEQSTSSENQQTQEGMRLAQEMAAALNSTRYTRNHLTDSNFNVGADLFAEYIGRGKFHQCYAEFIGGLTAEVYKGAIDKVRAEWLDMLFHKPEFRYLLQYYLDHGKEFIGDQVKRAKDGSDRSMADEFREKAMLTAEGDLRRDGYEVLDSKKNKGLDGKVDLKWAQNLAEHFWEFSGQRARQAAFGVKLESDEITPKTVIDAHGVTVPAEGFKDGNVGTGGNFVARDIFRFEDRAKARLDELAPKPFMELFRGLGGAVPLDERTFIEHMIYQFQDNNISDLIVTDSTGALSLNLNSKAWDTYRFKTFQESSDTPMGFWGFRYVKKVDEARIEILNWMKRPTEENFVKAASKLDYLAKKQPDAFKVMLINHIKFRSSPSSRLADLEPLKPFMGDLAIVRLSQEIGAEQLAEEVADAALGLKELVTNPITGKKETVNHYLEQISLMASHFRLKKVLWDMFWELFTQIFGQSFKDVLK